eukprot:m.44586 g.44586  ORF g.44586 m.44586 type:complete len:450 (-) comp10119_c0_seq1:256-1605(-)
MENLRLACRIGRDGPDIGRRLDDGKNYTFEGDVKQSKAGGSGIGTREDGYVWFGCFQDGIVQFPFIRKDPSGQMWYFEEKNRSPYDTKNQTHANIVEVANKNANIARHHVKQQNHEARAQRHYEEAQKGKQTIKELKIDRLRVEEELKSKIKELEVQCAQIKTENYKLKEELRLLKSSEAEDGAKTFANSKYKELYDEAKVPVHQTDFVATLRSFLHAYGISETSISQFLTKMKKDPKMTNAELAQPLWTSELNLSNGRTFYSILNEVIRNDKDDERGILKHATVIARTINQLCVAARLSPETAIFPRDGCVYRGAVIPTDYIPFFSIGRSYRVPQFLATSFNIETAQRFCTKAKLASAKQGSKHPGVIWYVHVDPCGSFDNEKLCKNANFIERSNYSREEEYLFVPYSVFTVTMVHLSTSSDYPHIIHVQAAPDNKEESETLMLAPWS